MTTVALFAAYGPEVRAFVHSGLVQRLANQYHVVIYTTFPESKGFDFVLDAEVKPMPIVHVPEILNRVRYQVKKSYEVWLSVLGKEKWRHYLPDIGSGKPFMYKLASFSPSYLNILRSTLAKVEEGGGKLLGTHSAWKQEFIQTDVQCVISSSYSSHRMLPVLQTASNMGIDTLLLTNSWKDIYVNPHVPVSPTIMGVWTEQMALDILEGDPKLHPHRVKILGSLHLEKFLHPSQVMTREVFYQHMRLDPERPYICYTAASPKAVQNELQVVKFLLESIEQQEITGKPQVLLRLNPMEDGKRFESLQDRYPDLVIQKPAWEWDAEQDWCCALHSDVEIWLATVYHAALNVSIPSTVTLEFAALEKPVVNVCFDLPKVLPPDRSNRRFWEGEFYKVIRKAKLAKPAFSPEQLLDGINGLLGDLIPSRRLPAGLETSPVDAVLQIVSEIVKR